MVHIIFRTNQDMSKYRVLINSLTVSKPLHTGNTNLSPIDSLLVCVGIRLEEKYMLYCLAVLTTKFGQNFHLLIMLGSSITNSMRLTYS